MRQHFYTWKYSKPPNHPFRPLSSRAIIVSLSTSFSTVTSIPWQHLCNPSSRFICKLKGCRCGCCRSITRVLFFFFSLRSIDPSGFWTVNLLELSIARRPVSITMFQNCSLPLLEEWLFFIFIFFFASHSQPPFQLPRWSTNCTISSLLRFHSKASWIYTHTPFMIDRRGRQFPCRLVPFGMDDESRCIGRAWQEVVSDYVVLDVPTWISIGFVRGEW